MSAVLGRMTPAFRDPVHGAQQTFRTVLDAMSRPGSLVDLPRGALTGLVPPDSRDAQRPMGVATATVLLALFDAETSVCLRGALATESAIGYLRFHTGVRQASAMERAAFTVARSGDVDVACRSALYLGSDEAPQDGATLLVEVDELGGGSRSANLLLRGPGIASETALAVEGLPESFWSWRIGLQAELPRGVDLILACGDRIAALPRTTRIVMES